MCKQRPRNEGICELFPISWVIKLLYLLWITRTKRGYQPCNNLKGLCRYESSVNEAFPAWYLLWLKHTKKKKGGNNFVLSTILLSFNHFTQKQGGLREILLGRDTYPNIVFLAEKTKNWLVHKVVVANPLILTCCWRVMGLSLSLWAFTTAPSTICGAENSMSFPVPVATAIYRWLCLGAFLVHRWTHEKLLFF